jgi:cell wall-associated NlpC family hydrolase
MRGAALALLAWPLAAACAGGPAPAPPSPARGPAVTAPMPRTGPTTAATPGHADPADSLFRGAVSELDMLRVHVIAAARGELGKPYKLGGTGDAKGWDCSGLIQFAYEQHGIALPRVSRDQALAGIAVPRDAALLAPGDLLTFSRRPGGKTVTHVGMYVGEGRFIHSSSSRGVVESALAEDDPEGRWWLRRWLGVRRILTE